MGGLITGIILVIVLVASGISLYQSWGNRDAHKDLKQQIGTVKSQQEQVFGPVNSKTTRDWSAIGVNSTGIDSAETEVK